MLNLKQTTELLAKADKLTERQFKLISKLHKENLAKANKLQNKDITDTMFIDKPIGDIRYNPALGKKYEKIRPGIVKAATTPLPAKAIDPNTGEYVSFNKLQKDIMHKALQNGYTRTEAILKARRAYK